jgi:3-oxoacyl-[acyl-carrier protein] reductase
LGIYFEEGRKRKRFFFEKKQQKTFKCAARRERWRRRCQELASCEAPGKSFLVLFFKKERLPTLALPMTLHSACITGAASGLGEAIARGFHHAGYRVLLADIVETQALANELDATGATAKPFTLDVREKPAFKAALDTIVQHWGSAQILINCAARTPTTALMDITQDEFDDVLAINLRGAFFGCQVFGAYFATQGYGRIINMASLAGQNGGTATGVHYASSKGAIITLTKVFARDLAKSGVTVNAIAPGPIDTPSVRAAVPPERMGAIKQMIPVGTIGEAGYIAATALHLASPAAGFVTGATWDINGGLFMR